MPRRCALPRRRLTPSTLGCAFLKPLTWKEDTVGWMEPEASWAARGSVAGMTSVMIRTPPDSVTVVAITCRGPGMGVGLCLVHVWSAVSLMGTSHTPSCAPCAILRPVPHLAWLVLLLLVSWEI